MSEKGITINSKKQEERFEEWFESSGFGGDMWGDLRKCHSQIDNLQSLLKQSQDEAMDYRSLIVDIKELEPLHMDGHLHWKGMNAVIKDKCRNVLAKHTKTEKEG